MRVRVRFRYRADTGEVELFEVDDLRAGPRLPDHDARHDHAAADVARIVEANALIEEAAPGVERPQPLPARAPEDEPDQRQERERSADG